MEISLLCWNIQKRSMTKKFQHVFENLLERHPSHIVAIQEVRLPHHGHMPHFFKAFSHALSCNIVRNRECFGVMTLSRYPLLASEPYLSQMKEIGFATRKSAVLTKHLLPNGKTLAPAACKERGEISDRRGGFQHMERKKTAASVPLDADAPPEEGQAAECIGYQVDPRQAAGPYLLSGFETGTCSRHRHAGLRPQSHSCTL
ncbi:MAG: hypothetical protein B6D59_08590 [Campylobacteraceae bacterium 4484_4]|nr:MAG: hypothetical protein B6D59_08590 [Campylobacteraceae bacterium 4484_4]